MTILCYHAIEQSWESPLAVTPSAFSNHCQWLVRNRTVIDLPHAVENLSSTGRIRPGLAALTFDDGFQSVYERAFPILSRFGVPATVFLVARTLTESPPPIDWVLDPPSGPLRTLSLENIIEMQGAGVSFGSHSYRHQDLTGMTDSECEQDLRTSREILGDLLGRPISFLAYPGGRHDERVRRQAQRAGFTHAFALPETRTPAGPHAIPRVGMYRGNGTFVLRIKSAAWYLPVRTSALWGALRPGSGGHRRDLEARDTPASGDVRNARGSR
jgi:peptidoglycan/xylan/chitin deacetylase (PgdA/CDA1 family)